MNLLELYRQLETHDWFHAMSDDSGVYNDGQRNWIRLAYEARKIEGGNALFREYSKWVFSGEAFGTAKNPKPDMPKEQPVYVERSGA